MAARNQLIRERDALDMQLSGQHAYIMGSLRQRLNTLRRLPTWVLATGGVVGGLLLGKGLVASRSFMPVIYWCILQPLFAIAKQTSR